MVDYPSLTTAHGDVDMKCLVSCSFCSKVFGKAKSRLKSKHGVYFCSRICKDKGQSIEGGVTAIQPDHYGNGIHNYRSKVDLTMCVGCGESRNFLLVAHHIDGDRKNNLRENLECVCQNCHALRHLKCVDGVWIYCSKVLTPIRAIGIAGNTPPSHGGVEGSNPFQSTI
jgi:hypothetical protein